MYWFYCCRTARQQAEGYKTSVDKKTHINVNVTSRFECSNPMCSHCPFGTALFIKNSDFLLWINVHSMSYETKTCFQNSHSFPQRQAPKLCVIVTSSEFVDWKDINITPGLVHNETLRLLAVEYYYMQRICFSYNYVISYNLVLLDDIQYFLYIWLI